ncbi:hypothetical protein ASD46_03335 [Rhizobium sp. Root491]|nr:hypothetical protein ASD46_03335 [Rhizobium sp. Root491]OMP72969.1 hypothetical protein BV900_06740 [Agrobacterium tumefaciens]
MAVGFHALKTMSEARRAFAFAEAAAFPLRHPGPDPGSIAIKSLIVGGFFHHADAPWLDAGSSPARQRWVYALYPQIRPVLVFLTANPVYDIICR